MSVASGQSHEIQRSESYSNVVLLPSFLIKYSVRAPGGKGSSYSIDSKYNTESCTPYVIPSPPTGYDTHIQELKKERTAYMDVCPGSRFYKQ